MLDYWHLPTFETMETRKRRKKEKGKKRKKEEEVKFLLATFHNLLISVYHIFMLLN